MLWRRKGASATPRWSDPMGDLLGPWLQEGLVVRDIEASMARWALVLGVGPFFHIPRVTIDQAIYCGKPIRFDMAVSIAFRDDVMIELIQPLDDARSPFTDFLAASGEGLQHHGFYPDDQQAAERHVEAEGLIAEYQVMTPGAERRTSFYSDPMNPGPMIELIEGGAAKRKRYAPIRAAAGQWRPGDPVWTPWIR
jgi:hypothetical protein